MYPKKMKTRIIHKHAIEADWLKSVYIDGIKENGLKDKNKQFIPKQAEIIVFDKDENYDYERFKIGDGITNVIDLPFVNQDILNKIEEMKENYVPRMDIIDQQRIETGNPVNQEALDTFKQKFSRVYVERSWRDTNGDGVPEPRGMYGKIALTPRGDIDSLPRDYDEDDEDVILGSVAQRLGDDAGSRDLAGHILVNPELPSKVGNMYDMCATPRKYVDEKIAGSKTYTDNTVKGYVPRNPMSSEEYYKHNTVYESRYNPSTGTTYPALKYIADDYNKDPIKTTQQQHIPLRSSDGRLYVRETPVEDIEATSKKYVDE